MRASLILLVVAGCAEPTIDAPASIKTCTIDSECSTGVCARTGECQPAADVRRVQVIWTIGGQPPTEQSCYWIPNMRVEFWTEPDPVITMGEVWESGSLPCTLGKFTVDKLPLRFWIGGAKSPSAGMWVPLDGAGIATVDLP